MGLQVKSRGMTLPVEEIIYKYCEGRLFPNPDYYEGRGNNLHDLNSPVLELVYKGIHTEVGPEAARAFVNMVKNLKDTNAASFLHGVYKLEKKEWVYKAPVLKVRVKDVSSPTAETPQAPTEAPKRMIEVLNAFRRSGSSFGHDKGITDAFLAKHKDEIDASLIAQKYTDVAG